MSSEKKTTTTREKILESGKRWFLELGFKSAPLRKIVADAGFTQGAFYGYFQTKEDLFYALTDEAAREVLEFLNSVKKEVSEKPIEQQLFEMSSCYLRRLPEFVSCISKYREEVRLILTRSEGTKYEGILSALAERNARQLKERLSNFFEMSPLSERTVSVLINGYFSMLAQVVLLDQNEEETLQMLTEIQKVYEYGIMALFSNRKREGV